MKLWTIFLTLNNRLASMKPAIIGSPLLILVLSACMKSPSVQSTSHPTPAYPFDPLMDIETVENNQDWDPYSFDHSGVQMVLGPPGCFLMGVVEDQVDYLSGFPSSNMDLKDYQDQMPAHEICFYEPYWIDVFEVTQAQFSTFNGESGKDSFFSGENLPREQLTWIEAQNFCQLREARLPTEAEWEYTARGPDSLLFPWGDNFDCRNGNFDDTETDDIFLIDGSSDCDGFPGSAPVGSILNGKSWVGALDLSGNVWEWVADIYQSQYYKSLAPGTVNPLGPAGGPFRVVWGGAWSINEVDHLSSAFRGGIDPNTVSEHLGLRCAKAFE